MARRPICQTSPKGYPPQNLAHPGTLARRPAFFSMVLASQSPKEYAEVRSSPRFSTRCL